MSVTFYLATFLNRVTVVSETNYIIAKTGLTGYLFIRAAEI